MRLIHLIANSYEFQPEEYRDWIIPKYKPSIMNWTT